MNTKDADIKIVPAEKRHIGDCLDSVGGSGIGRRYFADRQHTRRLLRGGIKKKEIFVGVDGCGAVAGFYWSSPAGMFCRFPYLRILAVKPSFRNKGVGKRLLLHFEENGFGWASKVFLAVSDFNTAAQRFYKRNGYVRIGTIPELYKKGIAEILMMKSSA
jgi:GNAT superfamily N-acetyltransferase